MDGLHEVWMKQDKRCVEKQVVVDTALRVNEGGSVKRCKGISSSDVVYASQSRLLAGASSNYNVWKSDEEWGANARLKGERRLVPKL